MDRTNFASDDNVSKPSEECPIPNGREFYPQESRMKGCVAQTRRGAAKQL